jgi:hypothetical protein
MKRTVGTLLQPCFRIGGIVIEKPLLAARLQTDGSYKSGNARVATVLETLDRMNTHRDVHTILADSSEETEWASVAFGIRRALELNQQIVEVENDNFQVVTALMDPQSKPRPEYARYYREVIYYTANQGIWFGIRWIPRGINDADALFRRQRATR